MAPDFYFAAMSPYSWFAAERIGELIPAARWRPVFAGGIFRAAGRMTWGLTEERAAKIADCEARAERYGLGPIVWPPRWPTNDITIARALTHAERAGVLEPFALAAMRLGFEEGADLEDLEAVAEAARRSGLDGVREAVADPEVKAALRATNDEAVERGVFGIPTVVAGGRVFWGDDRLEEAARCS